MLCSRVADLGEALLERGKKAGYAKRMPAPLISDFWKTNFAPSSSEVVFREMEGMGADKSVWPIRRICTVHPCVRFVDLSPHSDGIHLVHFHMFTCFTIGCCDPLPEVQWFLETLRGLGAPTDRSYYTYYDFTSSTVCAPRFPEFAWPLLSKLRVSPEQCIACRGLANYITDIHKDETGNQYEAFGPRIEIMCNEIPSVEYGTLIYSTGNIPGDRQPYPPVLSMVAGIERLAMVIEGVPSFWNLQQPAAIHQTVCSSLFGRSSCPPFAQELAHLIEVLSALMFIASSCPGVSPGAKGVSHQLRRMVLDAARRLVVVGMPTSTALGVLVQHLPGANADAANRVGEWLASAT